MKNAEVWERIRLNIHSPTMSTKRVRMVIKGAFDDLYFERLAMKSKKIIHFPAKSIVTTVALGSSKSKEEVMVSSQKAAKVSSSSHTV